PLACAYVCVLCLYCVWYPTVRGSEGRFFCLVLRCAAEISLFRHESSVNFEGTQDSESGPLAQPPDQNTEYDPDGQGPESGRSKSSPLEAILFFYSVRIRRWIACWD